MPSIRTLILPILAAGLGVTVLVGVAIHTYELLKNKIYNKKRTRVSAPVLLLDPMTKYSLPLIEREEINHNTRRFRFGLPTPNHILGLPIGQHVRLTTKIREELVIRSYTPISSDDDQGYVDLVIKVYFKNVHPRFPEGGKMSQYLENMKIGDTIDFAGPSGRLVYKGRGRFLVKIARKEPPAEWNMTKIVMLAGGTGITPMLQLIREIIKDPEDITQVSLLFANQTVDDILLRDELDDIAQKYPDKLKLWYTVDTSVGEWTYSTGYIDANMIKKYMFPPSSETAVLMCGPLPMINFACVPNLDKLGYDPKLRYAY